MRPDRVSAGFTLAAVVLVLVAAHPAGFAQTPPPRPMTFLDMQQMKQIGAPAPSPDGEWLLYTLSTPNWQEAERQTDLYLVSLVSGLTSTRQMTFTTKNETAPAWAADSRSFFFLSNREAPANAATQNQIYWMRPDGGEARRVTDARDGVVDFTLSPDGTQLAYRSGRADARQLYRVPVAGLGTAAPEQITTQPAGVDAWQRAPDSRRIASTRTRRPAARSGSP
jgi:Tol biopolymer transport system component